MDLRLVDVLYEMLQSADDTNVVSAAPLGTAMLLPDLSRSYSYGACRPTYSTKYLSRNRNRVEFPI